MLGRAARTHRGPSHDPVKRLRKRLGLSSDHLAELEHAVERLVTAVVGRALPPKTATDDRGGRS
jgi:hypothetical protein